MMSRGLKFEIVELQPNNCKDKFNILNHEYNDNGYIIIILK